MHPTNDAPNYGTVPCPSEENSIDREGGPQKTSATALYMVVPIAFFSSMGMAATSATTIFAYEALLCEHPSGCQGGEKDRYVATVAFSATIANLCGILVLGLLPLLPRRNPKAALLFWLISRSTSVAILALGVYCKNVWIALSGRAFEGFATDNILQLALNSTYVRAPQQSQVSRLFGVSLALYMIGQALAPSVAGLFTDYRVSFALAIGIFALCIVYLWFLPTLGSPDAVVTEDTTVQNEDEIAGIDIRKRSLISRMVATLVGSLVQPLKAFLVEPVLWGPGMALFFFLCAISYIYPALMVFAAMRFNFTGTENGWIISTAAASSSVYLLLVHFVWAELRPTMMDEGRHMSQKRMAFSSNFWNAMVSMILLGLAFPLIGFVSQSWQLFPLVAIASIGLSTPSFIKSYAVTLVVDRTQALTALALMETCGAFLSPIILGSAQRKLEDGRIFIVSSGMIATAMLLFTLGAFFYALPARRGRSTVIRD